MTYSAQNEPDPERPPWDAKLRRAGWLYLFLAVCFIGIFVWWGWFR